MNKKSPANFGLSAFTGAGNIASRLMARGGKKKTRRALKKIDKRLGSIEEKLDASSQEGAVPEIEASMEAVDESVMESGSGGGEGAITPDGIEPVPGAVDALEEDSFATAGDSGLNMVRNIMRRKNKK